jgi:hypothetical protein
MDIAPPLSFQCDVSVIASGYLLLSSAALRLSHALRFSSQQETTKQRSFLSIFSVPSGTGDS